MLLILKLTNIWLLHRKTIATSIAQYTPSLPSHDDENTVNDFGLGCLVIKFYVHIHEKYAADTNHSFSLSGCVW